jgi:hypothetical protein
MKEIEIKRKQPWEGLAAWQIHWDGFECRESLDYV